MGGCVGCRLAMVRARALMAEWPMAASRFGLGYKHKWASHQMKTADFIVLLCIIMILWDFHLFAALVVVHGDAGPSIVTWL